MIFLGPLTSSRGLLVSFRNHEVIAREKSPWQQTLAVYVRPKGRFFVNDEEVERSNLRAKLLEYLNRRAEWTVYFEDDDDTLYRDDIYAMNTIQGRGAKIIWITPKLREEWRQKELSTRRIL
jgi:biopolymer transport protein ExbD